jgi:hypothetical protein
VGRTSTDSIKQRKSKQLHERAVFFRRLAIGAADPKFATKLQALVDEYEGEAARALSDIDEPGMAQKSAGTDGSRTEHHAG